MKPAIFSFFSGVGFLDLGFEDEGFEIVKVNEIYPPFMHGYKFSRSKLGHKEPIFGYDVSSIETYLAQTKFRTLVREMNELRAIGRAVGFLGGPPCPDFSVGGKNRGKLGDHGRLSGSYVDLICEAKPDFFLFENVKGLWRTKKHREFYEDLKTRLQKSGYKLFDRLVNATEYGTPQDRDRIILLGFNKDLLDVEITPRDWASHMKFPERSAFLHTWPLMETSSKALKGEPFNELTVEYWFQRNNVLGHPNRRQVFQPRAGLTRFHTVLEGDVSRKSYKRLHRFRYSPTAAYGNNEVHIHPVLPRRINVAEALSLQSLPAEFILPSDISLTALFKAIGNGVPFLVAKGLAQMIWSAIHKASR